MSKQFMKGNIYVFTKKNFLKSMGKKLYKDSFITKEASWVNLMNGNKVSIIYKYSAEVRGYLVNPEWCKCINEKAKVI